MGICEYARRSLRGRFLRIKQCLATVILLLLATSQFSVRPSIWTFNLSNIPRKDLCLASNMSSSTDYHHVNFFGTGLCVPVQQHPVTKQWFTSLVLVDQYKLKFLLHFMKNFESSAGATAFFILCPECDDATLENWRTKGLCVHNLKALSSVAMFAFREDGPMPVSQVIKETSEMRRHNPHMFFREWVKFILLEHSIGVALVDIDSCYYKRTLTVPLLSSAEDVVVESYWPNTFLPGKYSFPFGIMSMPNETISVMFNNGHAYFAATPEVRDFSRRFMGWVVGEIYLDFGFAQTAFMKLLRRTELKVEVMSADRLSGVNKHGLTVAGFLLRNFGAHVTGPNWDEKEAALKSYHCWALCEGWEQVWEKSTSIVQFYEQCTSNYD